VRQAAAAGWRGRRDGGAAAAVLVRRAIAPWQGPTARAVVVRSRGGEQPISCLHRCQTKSAQNIAEHSARSSAILPPRSRGHLYKLV
jgi:hypothetical protein